MYRKYHSNSQLKDLAVTIGAGAYGIVKEVSVHGTICAAKEIHHVLMQYAKSKAIIS